MTIEVRQLVIRSTVGPDPAGKPEQEDQDGCGDCDGSAPQARRIQQDVLAECRRLFATWLAEQGER